MHETVTEKLLIQSFSIALTASIKATAMEKLLVNDSNRAEYNQLLKTTAETSYQKTLKSLGIESNTELALEFEALIARLTEQ